MKPLFFFVLNCFGAAVLAQTPVNGLIFNDASYQKLPMKPESSRSIYVDLPVSASLKTFCPKAGDQKNRLTCVGWAVGYAARTILYAQTHHLTNKDLIATNAFSPDFIYRSVEAKSDCQIGIELPLALDVVKSKGIVFKQKLAPCPSQIPDSLLSQAKDYKIEDWVTLFPINADTALKINALKKSLAEGNPVIIGAYLPKSFQDLRNDRWMPTESLETYLNKNEYGHAICVVGYDDTKFGGAFEIQNSHGEKWGDSGFCWIRYADLAACTKYAFELINNIRPVGEMPRDSLVGDIQIVFTEGEPMNIALQVSKTYQVTNYLVENTKFKIVLNNHQPAFLYLLSTDDTYKMNVLFPYRPNISPALTYRSNQVTLPSLSASFKLDNHAGIDSYAILYCKTALDIEQVRQKMESATGSFQQRLQQVIGNQFIAPQDLILNRNSIQFTANLRGKTVVPIIVEMEHH